MSLLTGEFKCNTVTFEDKSFITRTIHVPGWGEKTIGDLDMERVLVEEDVFVSDEAENIDNDIFFYIEGWKLRSFSDDELSKAVAKEVGNW